MTSPSTQNVMESSHPEQMLDLLRQQASLFAKLESLAARQRRLVTSEDTRPLLALLADRQRISIELTSIAGHLEPVRRDWPAMRERLTNVERAEAERSLSESRERLQRIMDSDEQDARVLAARKQTVAAALRGAHDTGRAITAYHGRMDDRPAVTRLDEAL